MRAGFEYWWDPVNANSASATVHFEVWTENQYWYNDWQYINFGGDIDRTAVQYNNQSSGGAVLRYEGTDSYTYSSGSYGSSPDTEVLLVWISDTYNGSDPGVTIGTAVPPRPYAIPATQPWITATRISDSRIDVAWGQTKTAKAPYTSQLLQRRMWIGGGWSAWADYASFGGTATTYTDTSVTSNRVYSYRIRSGNSSGVSDWTGAAEAWMTPGPASSLTSVLNTNGTVTSTWQPTSYYGTLPPVTFTVERSSGGAAWTQVESGLTGTNWTDPSPVVGQNRYRVKAVEPIGGLASDFTAGNLIDTISTPNPPTSVVLSNTGASSFNVTFAGHQLTPGDQRKWDRVDAYVSVNDGAYAFRGSITTMTTADNTISMNIPGITVNARVQAKVVSVNPAGESEAAYSNFAYTQPAAVQTISVVRDGYVSDSVTLSWTAASWPGATFKVMRVYEGVTTETTVGVKTYADTIPLAKSATYQVYVIGPDAQVSAVSPLVTVPARAVDKSRIPGVVEIYEGSTLVRCVMRGSTQIWLR